MLQQKYIFIHMQRPYLPRDPLSPQPVQFADTFTDESPVIGGDSDLLWRFVKYVTSPSRQVYQIGHQPENQVKSPWLPVWEATERLGILTCIYT